MQKCLDTLPSGEGLLVRPLAVNQEELLLSAVSCSLPWSSHGWGQLPGTANGTQPLLLPPY